MPHYQAIWTQIALALMLTLTTGVGQAAWEPVLAEDGVSVQQRNIESSEYAETRGETVFSGTVDAVAAVLADADAAPKWLHECKEGRLVKQISLKERINYTVIDAPFFYDDRDSYIHSISQLNADASQLTIQLTGKPDFGPEIEDRVRVLDIKGHWEIAQQAGGKVKVVYQMVSNPQISAVGSVNDSMAEAVAESLKGIRKLAQQAPYKDQRFTPEQIAAMSGN